MSISEQRVIDEVVDVELELDAIFDDLAELWDDVGLDAQDRIRRVRDRVRVLRRRLELRMSHAADVTASRDGRPRLILMDGGQSG